MTAVSGHALAAVAHESMMASEMREILVAQELNGF
jgi:hypothetical protein